MSFVLPFFEKAITEAANGNTQICYLFESKADPNDWFQVTWDMLNLNYPFPEEPSSTLPKLGINGLENGLWNWEALKFVTFEHGSNAQAAANFVEDYVRVVFGITTIETQMTSQEQI